MQGLPAAPLRLVTPPSRHPSLGDMLQRLALISPADLAHLTRLVADVLRHAEREHAQQLPHFKDVS